LEQAVTSNASSLQHEWDAIVIGAGPAGALAARQLALGGRRVLLVDKKRFPRPKVCGACINARALSALEAAGLGGMLPDLGGLPLNQLEIIADSRCAHLALPPGLAVGRSEFDAALATAAVAAGCEFHDAAIARVGAIRGTRREVVIEECGAEPATLSAGVVLAADGLEHSCLSHNASFASEVAANSLIGLGTTIPRAGYLLDDGIIRMVAGMGGYVGLVALDQARINIAAAVSAADLRRFSTPANLVLQLLQQAGAAPPESLPTAQWHGTGALTRVTRQVADARLFLLGDATGYVEPFTGEGIAWALCSALLAAPLAEACLAGRASPQRLAGDWSRLHQAQIQRRQWWCRRVAWVLRGAWRRRLALAAAASFPWLAQGIAAHINARLGSSTR
jgi:flavin-dependent dehydrogenase